MAVCVLLTSVAVLFVSGCGSAADPAKLVDLPLPTSRFCGNFHALLVEFSADRPDSLILSRLADRFDADEQALREVRDADVADVARRIANALRALDGPEVVMAFGDLPREVCNPPPAYTWKSGDLMELQVPRDWQGRSGDWTVPGRGDIGTALHYGKSIARASLLGDDYRWLFPAAYLAVSRSLAQELRVNGGRTAVALDRIRRWMNSVKAPADCRQTRVAPYVKGVIWGFMRRSDGCGGFGSALIEIYAVALHRRHDASVVLLRLTGRHAGSIPVIRRAVESFHVIH